MASYTLDLCRKDEEYEAALSIRRSNNDASRPGNNMSVSRAQIEADIDSTIELLVQARIALRDNDQGRDNVRIELYQTSNATTSSMQPTQELTVEVYHDEEDANPACVSANCDHLFNPHAYTSSDNEAGVQ
ncbi:hypothetical protein BDV96DRAFT_655054 [Lophiotrema nucula]|uniref:Uncharacterized protein n=1 Tax=Lophiotrema nucula TaxID=690887 RepID=A0A6A5YFH9_9PLEO|nr:hypothetical protein BDV96DRAFT_655054 [Lophiotrema nucula]